MSGVHSTCVQGVSRLTSWARVSSSHENRGPQPRGGGGAKGVGAPHARGHPENTPHGEGRHACAATDDPADGAAHCTVVLAAQPGGGLKPLH
jgi:hypothetical protein